MDNPACAETAPIITLTPAASTGHQPLQKMSLSEHLAHSIPPELREMILDFTLEIIPGTTYVKAKARQEPKQLAIDHASRARVAKKYYSTQIFQEAKNQKKDPLPSFLRRLQPEHRILIKTLRFDTLWPKGRSRPSKGKRRDIYGSTSIFLGHVEGNIRRGVRGLNPHLRIEMEVPAVLKGNRRVWMTVDELEAAYHGLGGASL